MDLYHIPGDTGGDWRQNKFIEYAMGAPTVCHPTIIEYAKRAHWSENEFLTAAFYHCLFYEELTAISGVYMYGTDCESAVKYWDRLSCKPHTNPDKARVANMRLYPAAIKGWLEVTNGDPAEQIHQITTRKELRQFITSIPNIGGFSADLFENCVYNAGYNFGKRYPEWRSTPQLAIGMYRIMYDDKRADDITKNKSVLKSDEMFLDRTFTVLCEAMEEQHPGQKPEIWYTKLCSWANLFDGTRYGGYHHDRQLGNLYWHMENEPELGKLWDRLFFVRKKLWPKHMLGEFYDWKGIRKNRNKLWLERGLSGVEKRARKY